MIVCNCLEAVTVCYSEAAIKIYYRAVYAWIRTKFRYCRDKFFPIFSGKQVLDVQQVWYIWTSRGSKNYTCNGFSQFRGALPIMWRRKASRL